ncbi:protein kinase [Clonorchis sinensis]|uniref:Protein kinase n=1 Tax=Clonorchis sinensis TaxID=79923 RepID=G7YLW5_CLOSI|nr:protein kinase [Clonorchis sinensis]
MCSHDYSMYLASWLDESHGPALSLHILHTETPLQKAEIGIWNPLSREDGELLERLKQLFYGYTKVVEQSNDLGSAEQTSESRSVNLSVEHNEELETKGVIESESSVCGAGDIRANNVAQMGVPVHSVDSVIPNQIVSEGENVTGLVVFPNVAEQIESTSAAKPDEDEINPSSYQVTEVEDVVEEPLEVQTARVPGSDDSQLEDYSHSPDADQSTYGLNTTDHGLRTMLYANQYESNSLISRRKGLKLLFSLLRPFCWIFYQTRWPPFLAPGYLFTVNDDLIRYFGSYFYPASACQLAFELYDHRPRAEEPVPLILVDSLVALSPFSPVLNRVILLPRDTLNEYHDFGAGFLCTSVEWISPTQTFSTCLHRSGSTHLPGSALLAVLSFLSNWLAYLSRIELQGIVLGYSQYRDTYTVRPMGVACMYPATLGCGQLTLLDAWPLQLLVHSIRTCCSTLVYLSSRLSPRSNFMYPRLWFSFTDVDNI